MACRGQLESRVRVNDPSLGDRLDATGETRRDTGSYRSLDIGPRRILALGSSALLSSGS